MPRRFAPRNDMLKFAACPHMQERHIKQTCSVYAFSLAPHLLAPAETHPPSACHCELRPCTRARLPAFCMSLRTSAHTGVAIRFPRREAWQVGCCLGKFVTLSRIRLRRCFLLCATAGEADCPVAPLLAMTCRNMRRVSSCTDLVLGKFAGGCVFALSTAFRYTLPQGGRIVPSLYPVTHHCTSPSGKKERPREKLEK